MPFGVSVAAAKGDVGIGDFEGPALHDREVRRLLAATTVEIDEDIERTDGPNQNAPAKVYFKMANATEISQRVDHPLGHPRNPPSMSDVVGKLRQCAKYSTLELGDTRLNALCEMVARLETMTTARSLMDLMCVR
jgi:2-methylcitrate dehydratase PrpD